MSSGPTGPTVPYRPVEMALTLMRSASALLDAGGKDQAATQLRQTIGTLQDEMGLSPEDGRSGGDD
jgi:hypothetical protein